MKKFTVLALVIIGAAVVCCDSQDNNLERAKRENYGTSNSVQFSESDSNYYAAPSYKQNSYKGYGGHDDYGHDSYGYDNKGHDKGYGKGYDNKGYDKGYDNKGYDKGYGKGYDNYHDDGYGHEHHGYGYGTTKRSRSKLGLLALLPLLAIPALAALGIPAIAALAGAGTALVPVTTTLGTFIANPGRKKREAIYKEVQKQNPKLAKTLMETETIVNYLENMNVKIDLQDELMYNHLACSGLLDSSNECLQRLACEFNDPSNDDLPELEKQVSAIVLNNILTNKKITTEIKTEIKRAGQHGRIFSGKCEKFSCTAGQQQRLYKSLTGSS